MSVPPPYVIRLDPSRNGNGWFWTVQETYFRGYAFTRWGAKWAAQREVRRLLKNRRRVITYEYPKP